MLAQSPKAAYHHALATHRHLIRDGRNCRLNAPTLRKLSTPSSPDSSSKIPSSLAGTVPFHTAYVFLHTHAPPVDYPTRSKSPLWRALTLNARQWGGIVNFAWSPEQPVHSGYSGNGEGRDDNEAYVASVFSSARRGRLLLPNITLGNLDSIEGKIHIHCSAETDGGPDVDAQLGGQLILYICTHGSRDCRCGNTGGEVARALRSEIATRDIASKVSVAEVAHVGGHKYAANVLVYPYGEWLGNVQAFDVPRILDELLPWRDTYERANTVTDTPPLCPPLWRGRMGLDKDEQLALISKPV